MPMNLNYEHNVEAKNQVVVKYIVFAYTNICMKIIKAYQKMLSTKLRRVVRSRKDGSK